MHSDIYSVTKKIFFEETLKDSHFVDNSFFSRFEVILKCFFTVFFLDLQGHNFSYQNKSVSKFAHLFSKQE